MLERFLETLWHGHGAHGANLARWAHHLVHALLHRNKSGDEEKAYHYLDRVITAQDGDAGYLFPDNYRRSFASMAYDKGMRMFRLVQCLSALTRRIGEHERGRRWCELGLHIAGRIEGAQVKYKEVSDCVASELTTRWSSSTSVY